MKAPTSSQFSSVSITNLFKKLKLGCIINEAAEGAPIWLFHFFVSPTSSAVLHNVALKVLVNFLCKGRVLKVVQQKVPTGKQLFVRELCIQRCQRTKRIWNHSLHKPVKYCAKPVNWGTDERIHPLWRNIWDVYFWSNIFQRRKNLNLLRYAWSLSLKKEKSYLKRSWLPRKAPPQTTSSWCPVFLGKYNSYST